MTAARRKRKRPIVSAASGSALAGVLILAITSVLWAATPERDVVDLRTGLAIHGFDPVAYFTDSAPTIGREELEVSYAGVVWRFRNAGRL